jgi:hypothetical protein
MAGSRVTGKTEIKHSMSAATRGIMTYMAPITINPHDVVLQQEAATREESSHSLMT